MGKMKTAGLLLIAMLFSLPAAAQELNLNGNWICESACMCGMHPGEGSPTSIAQNQDGFLFTSECGMVGHGRLIGSGSIRIDDWSTTAIASPDQRKINFDNGAVWRR
jgi:hypothetical protein